MLHADKFKTRAAQSMDEMNKITIVTYNWDEKYDGLECVL